MIERIKKKQASAYRRFVESGIPNIDAAFVADKKRSRLCIRSEDCLGRVEKLYYGRAKIYRCHEDVSFRRASTVIPVEDVLSTITRVLGISMMELKRRSYRSCARPLAAKLLCQYNGLSQREVAALLGLGSGAGICQQIRRIDQKLQEDRQVQMSLQRIVDELNMVIKNIVNC